VFPNLSQLASHKKSINADQHDHHDGQAEDPDDGTGRYHFGNIIARFPASAAHRRELCQNSQCSFDSTGIRINVCGS
jgi:hypothetical protein